MKGARFFKKKGSTGCLLVHGLTSSTQEIEDLADRLHSKGYSVLCTLLKGHNTSPEDLSVTGWNDWYESVENDFNFFRRECSKIYVIGLSIGATLSMHLAADKNKKIDGLILLAPAIFYTSPWAKITPILKHFKKYGIKDYSKYYPGRKEAFFDIADENELKKRIAYKKFPLGAIASALRLISVVKKEIKEISVPTLIMHSTNDHTIKPESAKYIYRRLRLRPENKKLVYLKISGHVITVDYEKDIVFSEIMKILRKTNFQDTRKQSFRV